jgi:hypothetical protein
MRDRNCFMLQGSVPSGRHDVDGKHRRKLLFANLDCRKVWCVCLKQHECWDGLYPLLHGVCDLEKHKFLHSCNKTRSQNHVLVMLLLAVYGNSLVLKLLVESICPGGAASQSGMYTLLGYYASLTGYSLLTFQDGISPFSKDQENPWRWDR